MKDAIRAMLALQRAGGSLSKKKIIEQNRDNEYFVKLLYYALHPNFSYKVSEKTLRRKFFVNPAVTLTMTNIFEICDTLLARKALDDATVYQVTGFLSAIGNHDEKNLYIKILAKTLRLGVTAKTVNKVIPGLLPEWEVQQAYPIDKYPIKKGDWFWLTEKLNGVRATYYKGNLIARSGDILTGLDHIVKTLASLGEEYVFDGELTLKNKGGLSDNEAFRTATGIINSDAEDKTEICFTIFDVLSEQEFDKGESFLSYKGRREILYILDEQLHSDCVRILSVLYSGTDQDMIWFLLDQMVKQDKEGLMVNLDVPYKRARHKGILKVKRFYSMDLPVVGFEEGEGRLAGYLGSLVVSYKGNEVSVGSGFSDYQRKTLWEIRDSLIGTLCEVKYKEISSDKSTGAESLQFPVFVRLRTDKSDVSYG